MKIEANIRCMILSFLTKCRLAYLGKGIASTHKKDQKVLNGQLSTIWHIAHLLGTRYRVQTMAHKSQFLSVHYLQKVTIISIICSVTQTTFSTPAGNDAVTLNLTGMGKGEVWVNGESIGRYWVSFKAPSGNPSQSL